MGSLNCTQCPQFKTASPGSEYCYRCTLGQYWENHSCIQCPDHLYGDGVHCNLCPKGFQAEKGFCFKLRDQSDELSRLEELQEEEKKDKIMFTVNFVFLSAAVLLVCILKLGFGVKIRNFFSNRSTSKPENTARLRMRNVEQIDEGVSPSNPEQLNPPLMEGECHVLEQEVGCGGEGECKDEKTYEEVAF